LLAGVFWGKKLPHPERRADEGPNIGKRFEIGALPWPMGALPKRTSVGALPLPRATACPAAQETRPWGQSLAADGARLFLPAKNISLKSIAFCCQEAILYEKALLIRSLLYSCLIFFVSLC
jgi:hypothetical protein